MNANIDQWIQKWLDPTTGVMKLCHTCHVLASGQLSGAFNLTVYLAILDTVIGGFLLYKLVFPWVNRLLIRYSEAMALRRFGKLRSKSLCPFAAKVKLYGGRIRKRQTIGEGIAMMIPRLVELTKLGKRRKLDGFVVELPANRFARDLDNLSESFNFLLMELTRHDPSGLNSLGENVLKKGWQFTFNETRFFVTTFAPFYHAKHPRYSRVKDAAFVFLQPEYSFDNHGIGRRNSHREQVKQTIRKTFGQAGSGYDIALIKQPFEALKYVKPLNDGDPPVRWWESKPKT